MFDIQKATNDFVQKLTEADAPQWRAYIQSIDEALSSVKIRTQRDARRVELARHNLIEIRRHLKHLAHPILGDVNHGDNKHNHFFYEHFGLQRLMLFATRLKFVHLYTKQEITIRANLGEEMLNICAQLGWPSSEQDYL